MRALLASNDPVRLSFVAALLSDAGIRSVLLDMHASVMDGSIGAIPRRLAVAADEYDRARRILADAGEL
jgi:Putative prokaryotic signal transducing protein